MPNEHRIKRKRGQSEAEFGAEKDPTQEPTKRRAPYAPQACNTCRKRKGRCDGNHPCIYCYRRSLHCSYATSFQAHSGQAVAPTDDNSASASASASPSTQEHHRIDHPVTNYRAAQTETLPSHSTAVTATATSGLSAPYAQYTRRGSLRHTSSPLQEGPRSRRSAHKSPNASSAIHATTAPADTTSRSSQRRTARRYHGPTSPGYSLIAAHDQFKMYKETRRREKNASGGHRPDLVPDPDRDSDEDGNSSSSEDRLEARTRLATFQPHPNLARLFRLFDESECVRLIRVYQRVIGELHPICDTEKLVSQLPRLYPAARGDGNHQETRNGTIAHENDLLMLTLAIAIAIIAEASVNSQVAYMMYEHVRSHVADKLTNKATDMSDVVVVLMMGFYYFFVGKTRLAWRMADLAGRVAMELGLHSEKAAQECLDGDEKQIALATLSCTLLIIDRQWSAATGLPANFKESDFEMARPSLASTPFLEEMMRFTLISHKFNEPISKVARGEAIDEDDIEMVNFQIEQWRKRAVEARGYVHPTKWTDDSSQPKPPPWMTILYLRANAVRGILLRPFFIAGVDSQTVAEKIKPALDIVSDSLTVLSILDSSTNVFSEQHPNFQHFVVSTCALLFLVVLYTKKNKLALPPELDATYAATVQRNLDIAMALSAAYRHQSKASCKLCKHLQTVGEPLVRWCMLPEPEQPPCASANPAAALSRHASPSTVESNRESQPGTSMTPRQQRELQAAGMSGTSPAVAEAGYRTFLAHKPLIPASNVNPNPNLGIMPDAVVAQEHFQLPGSFSLESFDPLIFGWSMNMEGTFFPGGMV